MENNPKFLYISAFSILVLIFAAVFGARAGMAAQQVTTAVVVAQPTSRPAPTQSQTPPPTNMAIAPQAVSQAQLLAKYGDVLYPSLDDIPADLRAFYLHWVFSAAAAYNVPAEDIIAVHFAEEMGGGLRPLQTAVSRAGAVGVGQVTPGYWNGWNGGPRTYFLTDPSKIKIFGGCGTDFAGDGVADPHSLSDNVAATACGLAHDHISTSLLGSADHAAILANALAIYNSGKAWSNAPAITRQYAAYGVSWMQQNGATVEALAPQFSQ